MNCSLVSSQTKERETDLELFFLVCYEAVLQYLFICGVFNNVNGSNYVQYYQMM